MTRYEELFYNDIHLIREYLQKISETKTKLDELEIIKKIVSNVETIVIYTKNKKNGWYGVAGFFTNGEKMLRINEGAEDGSDDKNVSFAEFINNYEYVVGSEYGSFEDYE